MTRPNSKTEISDLDLPMAEATENVSTLAGEEAERLLRERDNHERAIARLRRLWESRGWLVRVMGTGLLLSAAIAFLIPKHYSSTARLMPPDNAAGSGLAMAAAALTGGAAGGLGGLGGLAGDLLGEKSTSDLYVGVLQSHTVEDKLIAEFDLKKVYGDSRIEDARKDLENWTDIAVDRKSQIITLKVTDKDPRRATAMAQDYVDELNRTLASVSTSAGRRERIFLQGRLQTVNQNLEAAEKVFSQFASKNGTIDLHEQGKAMVTAAAELEGELIAARSELEGLRQLYADSNVRVRSAQARVAELENQLAKVGGQSDQSAAQKAPGADSLYPSIRELPLLGVPYADLYRRIRVQEGLFEMLTEKYELAKVQEAKEIPTVKVLDVPRIPEKKSFPPRLVLMFMGTALTLAGAMVWMFGREKWERTDPADPGKMLAQEVFASVKTALPWASRNGHGTRPDAGGAGGAAGGPPRASGT